MYSLRSGFLANWSITYSHTSHLLTYKWSVVPNYIHTSFLTKGISHMQVECGSFCWWNLQARFQDVDTLQTKTWMQFGLTEKKDKDQLPFLPVLLQINNVGTQVNYSFTLTKKTLYYFFCRWSFSDIIHTMTFFPSILINDQLHDLIINVCLWAHFFSIKISWPSGLDVSKDLIYSKLHYLEESSSSAPPYPNYVG